MQMDYNEQQLNKLEKVLSFLDEDYVKSNEFVEAFGILMAVIKDLGNQSEDAIKEIEKNAVQIRDIVLSERKLTRKLQEQFNSRLESFTKELKSLIEKTKEEIEFQIPEKGDRGEPGTQGIPGKDGKDGSPDSGEQIVDKINDLKGKKKINAENVEQLQQTVHTIVEQGFHTGAFETPIKAGSNITVSKDASGAWVINSTSSGGGTWGTITGTLSDQTDLQTALDAKQDALTFDGTTLILDALKVTSTNGILFNVDGGTGTIDTASVTGSQTWALPSASGTIALTDDLSGFIDGSGAANRIPFFSDANTVTSSANLTYNGNTLSASTSAAANLISLEHSNDADETISVIYANYNTAVPVGGFLNFAVQGTTVFYVGSSGGMSVGGVIQPLTNDGAALGTGSNGFSDLHLASGAVTNYNNGNVTLTHSAGNLTLAGSGSANLVMTNGYAWLKRAGTGAGFYITDTTLATNNSSWGINTDASGNLIMGRYNAGLSLLNDSFQFLRATGNFNLLEGSLIIPATKGVYLDGGSNTYITESSADTVQIFTGGSNRLQINSSGLTVPALDTDGTAPATTGTTKMVITDANGLLSFDDIPAGGGDVVGPASSTDGQIPMFDDTTGKLLDGVPGMTVDKTNGYLTLNNQININGAWTQFQATTADVDLNFKTVAGSGRIVFSPNATDILIVDDAGITASADITVPDEAYASGWNGSTEVPTKNAVYDIVETVREETTMKAMQALGSAIKAQTVDFNVFLQTTTGNNLTDGQCKFVWIYLEKAQTITGAMWYQVTQGDYTPDNSNEIQLYSYSGGTMTEVATTGNDGDLWKGAANTIQKKAFTTPYDAQPGLYFIGFVYNNSAQTTAPAIACPATQTNNAKMTLDFTNSGKICSTLAAQTALPATQAMTGTSANTILPWLAVY